MDQPRTVAEDLTCRGIAPAGGAASGRSSAPPAPDERADQFVSAGTGSGVDGRGMQPRNALGVHEHADGPASDLAGDPSGDSTADLAGRLVRAFASAVRHGLESTASTARDGGDLVELRGALHAYVAGLCACGAPPERVLVGVKAAATRGSLAAWYPREAHREATVRQEAAALTERLVRWAVLAYYGEAST